MSVGIYEVKKYDETLISNTLDKIFEDLKVGEKIKENMNVVLKPDLTIGNEFKDYTATNYLLIKLIAKKIMKFGAKVVVCDRTDGKFSIENIEEEYKKLNVAYLEDAGINLNRNVEVQNISLQFESEQNNIEIIDVLKTADYIINIPKLKTNTMFGISGAVYNMFGSITSDSIKMLYGKYPSKDKMAKIALMVASSFKNQIIIVDAIEAMQGNGPSDGEKINQGRIVASDNMYEVDYVISSKVFKDFKKIPIISEIISLNKVNNLNIISDMTFKKMSMPNNFSKLSFLDKLSNKNFWPYIDEKKCIKCKLCVVRCPMDVIHEQNHKVVMTDRQRCTKCMYCLNQCPVGAIKIKKKKYKFKNNILDKEKGN